MNDHRDDSVKEEASAFGQRATGAAKAAAGAVTGDRSLEREGERENAAGNARQEANNVFDESDGVPGRTVGGGRGTVTGLFRDRDSAEGAYRSISTRGYGRDDVNLLMSEDTRKRHFSDATADTELGSKALEGAGAGSAIGGTVGAVLAAIAAIGTSVALPGLGLVVAGPLAAALV
ncbi:MAG: hypothetical protein ACRD68_13675, partial [Pyrinomonadaceae bacterium]